MSDGRVAPSTPSPLPRGARGEDRDWNGMRMSESELKSPHPGPRPSGRGEGERWDGTRTRTGPKVWTGNRSGVRSRLNNSKESGRSLWWAVTYGGQRSGPDSFFERDRRWDGIELPSPRVNGGRLGWRLGTGLEWWDGRVGSSPLTPGPSPARGEGRRLGRDRGTGLGAQSPRSRIQGPRSGSPAWDGSRMPERNTKVGSRDGSGVRSRLNNSKESGRSLWSGVTYGGPRSGPDTFA